MAARPTPGVYPALSPGVAYCYVPQSTCPPQMGRAPCSATGLSTDYAACDPAVAAKGSEACLRSILNEECFMTHSRGDRCFLAVPALCCHHAHDISAPTLQDADDTDTCAVLRAGLFYIAADLRTMANSAPIDRREQLLALSALVTSIAAR